MFYVGCLMKLKLLFPFFFKFEAEDAAAYVVVKFLSNNKMLFGLNNFVFIAVRFGLLPGRIACTSALARHFFLE